MADRRARGFICGQQSEAIPQNKIEETPMLANKRSAVMALAAAIALSGHLTAASAQAPPRMIPHFEVDPSWPKLPSKWVWGQVSSVSIDSQGHAWILQRPSSVRNDQKGMAAPRCWSSTKPVTSFRGGAARGGL